MKNTKAVSTKTRLIEVEVEVEQHAESGKIELLKDLKLNSFCILNGKDLTYYPNADQARFNYNKLTR